MVTNGFAFQQIANPFYHFSKVMGLHLIHPHTHLPIYSNFGVCTLIEINLKRAGSIDPALAFHPI